MSARSPIFSKKKINQRIGYIEDSEAFDLLGNRRCNWACFFGRPFRWCIVDC
jgi:hypothetical protein